MPGNRKVQGLLPIILAAAAEVAAEKEGLRFFLPVATTIDQELVRGELTKYPGLTVTLTDPDETYNLMAGSDLGILASGTATLEAALLGLPIIVTYHVSKVSALLFQAFANKEYCRQPMMVALPND